MTLTEVMSITSALADRSRLLMMRHLADGPKCGEELAQHLELTPSTVSFHLKKLETAKLVLKEKEQYYRNFACQTEKLSLTIRDLLDFSLPGEDERLKNREACEARQIRSFFRGKSLEKLPVQWKKRRLILKELAKRFAPNRSYAESEVNVLLSAVFPDYCLLRRELIEAGFLSRHNGIYQVIVDNPSPSAAPPSMKKEIRMDSRSEIKREFKEAHVPCGVFQIRNLDDGTVFIGKTMNLRAAFNRHPFELSFGSHPNKRLQKAWKQLGPEKFIMEVLKEIAPHKDGTPITSDELDELEKTLLAQLSPDRKWFNLI
jgi:biotin operon repressor